MVGRTHKLITFDFGYIIYGHNKKQPNKEQTLKERRMVL